MTYSELKTNIAAWLHRDDLTSYLDTFIDLFEAKVNRSLRVSDMEQRVTTTPTGQYIALPADFLEMRNVQVNTNPPQVLEYVTPSFMDTYSGQNTSGTPKFYTVVGGELQIAPYTTSYTIEMSYYEDVPALSSTTTSNWLSTDHPDYYLYGSILEALLFAQDDRAGQISGLVAGIEARINSTGRKKAYGAAPLVVRPN